MLRKAIDAIEDNGEDKGEWRCRALRNNLTGTRLTVSGSPAPQRTHLSHSRSLYQCQSDLPPIADRAR
jgi:hypothetical protein